MHVIYGMKCMQNWKGDEGWEFHAVFRLAGNE